MEHANGASLCITLDFLGNLFRTYSLYLRRYMTEKGIRSTGSLVHVS